MRHDPAPRPTVDRGRYPDTVTPWEQEDWRSAVLDWVGDALAARGLRTTGRPWVRLRPWSVLVRVAVAGHGAVWFKANPPASGFEGALTAALARWVPGRVLAPLAVDTDRRWLLLPDGGELFRDVLEREPLEPRAWEGLLGQYAALQHTVTAHTAEIGRLGVPGARTVELPDVFEALLGGNRALRPEDRARLVRLRPRVADWSAELAALGVADSLDHADLHEGQLFHRAPDRFTFFDWGDAVVSHPFCSLRVPARKAADRYGLGVLPRLRDAYLEPWTGNGRSAAELRRAVSLAWRLSALGRARAWGRLFPAAAAATPLTGQSAASLLELLEEPPL
ncbi:aminoglycoside phosphotransferase family protein [Streptomyces bungoensis]|uniref:aminoglycoside phosphotransferase family protein n=1 Tax=Streptomyces bungoensis TaxID=285568 RepID=UPI00341B8C7A